ncbi:MAG: hypothetical protein CM1200mP30_13020 [Pseudomonadota bacterium]|nr:MAG: hypothetical protein CM1200mP30_13020 [Pseudomonadota bacterium]
MPRHGDTLGDKVELIRWNDFLQLKNFCGEEKKASDRFSKIKPGSHAARRRNGGMTKVILSLQQGKIPATVGVVEPMSSKNDGILPNQIVRHQWNGLKKIRTKGCSECIWLWGTNAHIIFETGKKETGNPVKKNPTENTPLPMAIVGMEAIFGGCNGLHDFIKQFMTKAAFPSLPPNAGREWSNILN